VRVVTRKASEEVTRVALELARQRRKKVTVVHKANVLRKGCGLLLVTCHVVVITFFEVEPDDMHVDAVALELVRHPQRFDVLVAENIFRDILSNEAAGLIGGLGLAPGLNVGQTHAMAQAAYGSAPDIAGKGLANPVAEILSAAMLLDWLGRSRGDPVGVVQKPFYPVLGGGNEGIPSPQPRAWKSL